MKKSFTTRHRKQSSRSYLLLVVITVSVLGYFAFHALNGQYGLVGREKLDRQSHELQMELNDLIAKREELEAKVSLLRPESLDLDMIDERARSSLNLIQPDEVIILRNQNQR